MYITFIQKINKINIKKKMTYFKILFFILINILSICTNNNKNNNNNIYSRNAYHAGSWYESDPTLLSKEIKEYLSKTEKLTKKGNLKTIIVPHAGYRFSGPTAAKSFININPSNYNRLVILGPSHHEYFTGCGLTPFDSFSTPFGDVKVDIKYINKLLKIKGLFFKLSESMDLKEHSIEMEMPFLKYIFDKKDFSIIFGSLFKTWISKQWILFLKLIVRNWMNILK